MTFARRLAAATMALVLAVFPVALERCRTACVSATQTPQANIAGHACHEVAADQSGTRMDPMVRACGHSDEVRAYDPVSLASSKTHTIVPLDATQPSSGDLQLLPRTSSTAWPTDRSVLPRVVLPLNLPLRL